MERHWTSGCPPWLLGSELSCCLGPLCCVWCEECEKGQYKSKSLTSAVREIIRAKKSSPPAAPLLQEYQTLTHRCKRTTRLEEVEVVSKIAPPVQVFCREETPRFSRARICSCRFEPEDVYKLRWYSINKSFNLVFQYEVKNCNTVYILLSSKSFSAGTWLECSSSFVLSRARSSGSLRSFYKVAQYKAKKQSTIYHWSEMIIQFY